MSPSESPTRSSPGSSRSGWRLPASLLHLAPLSGGTRQAACAGGSVGAQLPGRPGTLTPKLRALLEFLNGPVSIRYAGGVDAVQALQLVMVAIGSELKARGGTKLRWEAGYGNDLGFPDAGDIERELKPKLAAMMRRRFRRGSLVKVVGFPYWVAELPEESRRVFRYCLGRAYAVAEVTDDGLLVLDVSGDVDRKFGGFMNDIRLEPQFVERVKEPKR
jgi:hypothetical protein